MKQKQNVYYQWYTFHYKFRRNSNTTHLSDRVCMCVYEMRFYEWNASPLALRTHVDRISISLSSLQHTALKSETGICLRWFIFLRCNLRTFAELKYCIIIPLWHVTFWMSAKETHIKYIFNYYSIVFEKR